MNTETLISLGYYVSSVGFLVATIMTYNAFKASSQSGIKTVLSYLAIGTGTFFIITVFQKMADLGIYNISDESKDIWWHIMFYLAMISFYFAFKTLANLGSSDSAGTTTGIDTGKIWGIISAVILLAVFILPNFTESLINIYNTSRLSELGAHHFLAFIMAGVVGAYVFSAKIFLGQIGRAIAGPMIIAIWALSVQHFWELLTESWKVIAITPSAGEGVEKIFLTIAAISIIYAVTRLQSFTKTA
ncbi:MAG: hypothetical protein WAX85_00615 [Minisyncoccia bacterium]